MRARLACAFRDLLTWMRPVPPRRTSMGEPATDGRASDVVEVDQWAEVNGGTPQHHEQEEKEGEDG